LALGWARNPLVAVLLLTAFFSRALVPVGFMPGPGGLTLCSGYAAVESGSGMSGMDMSGMDMSGMDMSAMTGHPGRPGQGPDHGSMGICPFAAAATAMATMQQASPVASLAPFVSADVDLPVQPFIPRGTIVPTRLPRGPPTRIA